MQAIHATEYTGGATAPAVLLREMRVSYSPGIVGPGSIRNPGDAARIADAIVDDEPREHFVGIYLDGRCRVIGHRVVSVGTMTASLVHPREVFAPAILAGASSIIVAHNHPTGNPTPSPEDRTVTARLRDAGKVLGIKLIDALVIARTPNGQLAHYSANEAGEIENA